MEGDRGFHTVESQGDTEREAPSFCITSQRKGEHFCCRRALAAGSAEGEGYNSRSYSRPICFLHSTVKADAVWCS